MFPVALLSKSALAVAVVPFPMKVALNSIDGSLSGAILSTTKGSGLSILSPM